MRSDQNPDRHGRPAREGAPQRVASDLLSDVGRHVCWSILSTSICEPYNEGNGPTTPQLAVRGPVGQPRVDHLPADVRRRYHLDEPGAQVEVVGRPDGVIELHPVLPHRADQAWFWTERWQAMEREVDEDIAAGRVETFDSAEEFIADLDRQITAADKAE